MEFDEWFALESILVELQVKITIKSQMRQRELLSNVPGKETAMLIKNGTVHTLDAPIIEKGFVAVRDGKIAMVGPMDQCPENWEGEIFDA